MATTDGKTTPAVMAELAADPHAFDFYAAVRLIQTAYPRHQRVGYSSDPREDPVRFAQSPALDFAPATLEAAAPTPAHLAARLPTTLAAATMPKKRRNGGRNRHGRGHTRLVDCSHCMCKPPKVRASGRERDTRRPPVLMRARARCTPLNCATPSACALRRTRRSGGLWCAISSTRAASTT